MPKLHQTTANTILIHNPGISGAIPRMPRGVPRSDPTIEPFSMDHASGRRRAMMKMLALVIPMDCTAKLKSRPNVAGSPNSRTRTGKPTVPPPMGVEPAT